MRAPSKQPFRMLRFDPKIQVDNSISADVSSFEREVLQNPARRLSWELSCPIDCPPPELDALYAALSDETAPTDELLRFADGLWPLARANFVAHVASRRPANATLLYALLESHAAIDANAIYVKLKAARTAAGIPAPSWVSINEGLDELLSIHCAAAFVGYETIEAAVEPVLECTQKIFAHAERHLVEALGILLASYRQFIDPLQRNAKEQIISACLALQQEPTDTSLIEELSNAVQVWMLATGPLLTLSTYLGRSGLDFETPIDGLRALIADLVENRHYEVAAEIADITRELFSAVPTTIDQLVEDAHLIKDLSLHTTIGRLQDLIDELESDPGPLIAALERDGFGQTSSEPAKNLWEAFVRATQAANQQAIETAWRLMQDFVVRLSNRPEAAAAVARLITGLIQRGERVSAAPRTLNSLRDNLSFMNYFIGSGPVEADNVAQTSRLRSLASGLVRRRLGRSASDNSIQGPRRYWRIGLAVLAVFVPAAGGAALYIQRDQARVFWSKLGAPTQPAAVITSGETMPPVGTGQHLAIDGVRYCHFQQERLRTIKREIQGPEDARAYNLLIVDYNARCSDFFYQDNDLKVVLAEVDAKKKLLEAEAKQVMSTWPGHAAKAEN